MADWAVVIGISDYTVLPKLDACTNDALRFRSWLVDPKGGNVDPNNILLALAPPRSFTMPSGILSYDARADDIIAVIDDLVTKSGGTGDRLFFYYSGHGLSNREYFVNNDTMVGSDCTAQYPTRTLTIASVQDYLATYQFNTQFFFIDACRNIPWPFEYRVNHWPRPRPGRLAVQQFVFYGTSPGKRSFILAGSPTSIFTEYLLRGLRGTGSAKVWDPRGRYLVRIENLSNYVSMKVFDEMNKHGDIQPPEMRSVKSAAFGDPNPILAKFLENEFLSEELTVNLIPPGVASHAGLQVLRDRQVKSEKNPVVRSPAKFALLPREYSLVAEATGYTPVPEQLDIDLYEKSEVTVEFKRGSGAPGSPTPPGPIAKSSLEVVSPDNLALLGIEDSTGNTLKSGFGSVKISNLDAGYYRIKLQTPENREVRKLVSLTGGIKKSVNLEAPHPPNSALAKDIIAAAGFAVGKDNLMALSEATPGIGAVATAEISTFLTLAGSVELQPIRAIPAPRLRKLGIQSFRKRHNEHNGIQVLFGFEPVGEEAARKYLSKVRFRIWPQGKKIPMNTIQLRTNPHIGGIAELTYPTSPGSYWMSIEFPERKYPIVFSIVCMESRLTMVILHVDVFRKLRVFQYTPTVTGSWEYSPAAIRRLEMIQRFYMNGAIDRAFGLIENIEAILYGKWEDPIMGLIGCYLLLKMGEQHEDEKRALRLLKVATNNLLRRLPPTSDSFILRGEYLSRTGGQQRSIKDLFNSALKFGAPLFSDGLQYLYFGAERFGVGYETNKFNLQKLFSKNTRSSIWTTWTPQKFVLGKILLE